MCGAILLLDWLPRGTVVLVLLFLDVDGEVQRLHGSDWDVWRKHFKCAKGVLSIRT